MASALPNLITLEEHFISTTHIPRSISTYQASFGASIQTQLSDLGPQRLTSMDANNISYQIISHAPIVANAAECRAANDELASACAAKPSRLGAFAMLPMLDPDAAAAELTRCISEHGRYFHGALINNTEDDTFYDDPRFWTVFRSAAQLDVPIYIHPSFPSAAAAKRFEGNFSQQAASFFGTASWSWHAETGLHFLRLFAAGLFDEVPGLKIILGHDGEMLPFMLDRIEQQAERWGKDRRRSLREVWRENVWVTTSAMFSLAPLACLLRVSPAERVLFSVDYPFVGNEKGVAFLRELRSSGLVSEEEFEGVCEGNARRLLNLPA